MTCVSGIMQQENYMHDLCVRDHAAGQQRAGDPGAQAHCQAVHQVQSFFWQITK